MTDCSAMNDKSPRSKCDKCGTDSMELSDERGHMQTFKCFRCGWQSSRLVYVKPPGFDAVEWAKPVKVFLVWDRGRPSNKEIMAARRLVARLNAVPVFEMVATMGSSARWDLGIFDQGEAEVLKKKAMEANLNVEYELV